MERRRILAIFTGVFFISLNIFPIGLEVSEAEVDNARFVQDTIPSNMAPGEVRRVSITVENSGSSAWSESNLFRLGAGSTNQHVGCPHDNEFEWSNWEHGGYSNGLTDQRAFLSGTVYSGSRTTFTFDIRAPSAPGTHWFEARMVHDGVCWFGDVLSKAIEVSSYAPPPQGKSKLTIHTGMLGSLSMPFIERAKPTVVKLLDNFDQARNIKQRSPGTLIVGRIFLVNQPMDGSPEARAQEWWNSCRDRILAYPEVDYWEGYNEPPVETVDQMRWLARFEVKRIQILAENGRKACIGSFSVGRPEIVLNGQPYGDIWRAFYPAIDEARARGGVLGLHEYSAPTMQDGFDLASGEGWFTGRYRKVYRWFLIPDGKRIPLIITECGIDGGVLGQHGKGWKSFTTKDRYMDQLKWYDSVIKEDDYVLGATIFCLEIPDWEDFDIAPLMLDLTEYVSGEAAPPLPSQVALKPAGLSASTVSRGTQLRVTYNWEGGPTPYGDWKVFVHFAKPDGSTLFQDDHWPTPGTSSWSGATSYSRTLTVPSLDYRGEVQVWAGLYDYGDSDMDGDIWERLELSTKYCPDDGYRRYRIATFQYAEQALVNNAGFVSQRVRITMLAGQAYSVRIVMKNTGTTTWTESEGYRLGSQNPQDNQIWGTSRVLLSSGESIAPGQKKVFTFRVIAPSTPGTYNFQWRMLREFVEWFGECTPNVEVRVISQPVLQNQGFEAGTDGWSPYQSTISSSSEQCRSGTRSLYVYVSGPAYTIKNGISTCGGAYTTQYIAVYGSVTYTASVWVKRTDTTAVEAMIYIQQFAGTTYGAKLRTPEDPFIYDRYAKRTLSSANKWVKLEVTFTTHPDARYVVISLCVNSQYQYFYFDDVSLTAIP